MSAAPPPPSAPAPPAAPAAGAMVRAMLGVGLVCGLAIVTVFQLTRPVIARKRAEALERAIFEVLPDARSTASFRWRDDGRFEPAAAGEGDGERVHAGYDAEGRLAGLAVEARGMGYQDLIHVLYGYSPERHALVGLRVLESRETPGLGDRIETDPAFQRNFERLDVALAPGGGSVAHPIEAVKHGEKRHPWQVDGITGATISSQAIADLLRASTDRWVPRIEARLDDFRRSD